MEFRKSKLKSAGRELILAIRNKKIDKKQKTDKKQETTNDKK